MSVCRRCRQIIFGVLICLVSMPLVRVAANGGKTPAVATDAEKLLGRAFGAGALLICLLQM